MDTLNILLEMLITSSVLIGIVLLLRFIFKKRISRKLRYLLWVPVVLKLLLPLSFFLPAPVSVMNVIKTPPIAQRSINIGVNEDYKAMQNSNNGMTRNLSYTNIPIEAVVFPIWGAGTIIIGASFIVLNMRFRKKLKNSRQRLELPEDVISCKLPVYLSDEIASPCLVGVIKPEIYLNSESVSRGTNSRRLSHILTHELSHYSQLDHVWTLLRIALLAIYWFNPLVWVAAICSRTDCELACDELSIKRLGEDEQFEYGKTLVELVEKRTVYSYLTVGTTSMAAGKSGIKERVKLIAKPPRTIIPLLILLAAAMLFVIGCTFTSASAEGTGVYKKNLTAEQAARAVEDSITYSDGYLYFTIPEDYKNPADFNILVYGRVRTADGSGQSFHLLEKENEERSWERGKQYKIVTEIFYNKEIEMSIFMDSDSSVERVINLGAILSANDKEDSPEKKLQEELQNFLKTSDKMREYLEGSWGFGGNQRLEYKETITVADVKVYCFNWYTEDGELIGSHGITQDGSMRYLYSQPEQEWVEDKNPETALP